MSEFVSNLKLDRGHEAATARTSIGAVKPSDSSKRIAKLSRPATELILNALKDRLEQSTSERTLERKPQSDLDLLDSHYADEVLTKLEEIVRRASHLNPLEKTTTIPSASVEKYFEEAHRCFLYGFPVATAVLCRAMLESRLLELRRVLDPSGQVKKESEQSGQSYLKALIKEAVRKELLSDGRSEREGNNKRHWADSILMPGIGQYIIVQGSIKNSGAKNSKAFCWPREKH